VLDRLLRVMGEVGRSGCAGPGRDWVPVLWLKPRCITRRGGSGCRSHCGWPSSTAAGRSPRACGPCSSKQVADVGTCSSGQRQQAVGGRRGGTRERAPGGVDLGETLRVLEERAAE
jgi:hypothetical protein